MMTERADPRRAQVAQVDMRKRSHRRPWYFTLCEGGACISANQRPAPALSPP